MIIGLYYTQLEMNVIILEFDVNPAFTLLNGTSTVSQKMILKEFVLFNVTFPIECLSCDLS